MIIKNNRVLIVGGAGYIGSVLTRHFLKKNFKVTVLDALLYDNYDSVKSLKKNKNFIFIRGNFNNYLKLKKALKNVSTVVFLAGLVGDPISKKYPKKSRLINYYYIKKCFERLKKSYIKKLIFVSSCSNYGLLSSDMRANENSRLNPLSYYAIDKVKVEKFLIKNKEKFNFSTIILRFATAFGCSPRMRFDLTINDFVKQLYFNETLKVYDSLTWRPYCHVKDFSMIIKKVIDTNFSNRKVEIYNCGNNKNNFTKNDIIKKIKKFIPNGKIDYADVKGTDRRNYRVNFDKLEKQLKFKTKYSIEYGIKEIILYLKKNFYKIKKESIQKFGNFSIERR